MLPNPKTPKYPLQQLTGLLDPQGIAVDAVEGLPPVSRVSKDNAHFHQKSCFVSLGEAKSTGPSLAQNIRSREGLP